jgi:hypothetical protein
MAGGKKTLAPHIHECGDEYHMDTRTTPKMHNLVFLSFKTIGGGGKKGFGVLVAQQSIEAQNAHETHQKCAAGFFLSFK